MPLREQVARASLQFFPDELDTKIEDLYQPPRHSTTSREGSGGERWNSRRPDSALLEIVGEGNGERPGGFVLVVDGAGLLEVSFFDLF